MTHPPTFSVIIPTYNRAALVDDAIRSVLAQTYPNWELIVVDDGSTDDTPKVLVPYGADERITVIYQRNRGKSGARNRGIEAARGHYLCFLDSDDWWLSHHLATLAAAIERQPDFSGIYRTRMQTVRGEELLSVTQDYEPASGMTPFEFFGRHMVGIHTLAYPSAVFDVYRYDERFRYFQDTQLLLRILRAYPLRQLPVLTAICRDHRGRSSHMATDASTILANLENNVAAIRSVFPRGPADMPAWEHHLQRDMVAKKYYDYATILLAGGHVRASVGVIKKALRQNNTLWSKRPYLKYFASIATKVLFDYPKLS